MANRYTTFHFQPGGLLNLSKRLCPLGISGLFHKLISPRLIRLHKLFVFMYLDYDIIINVYESEETFTLINTRLVLKSETLLWRGHMEQIVYISIDVP